MRSSFNPSGSHRSFPTSLRDAERLYPDVVISIALGKVRITSIGPSEHASSLVEDEGKSFKLVISDADIGVLKRMSETFGPPLSSFPSEPIASIRDRIRALIRVQFAGRGAY